MLNTKYDKKSATLELTKYLEDVDFTNLQLSKTGKSYSVAYDTFEFITSEGVLVRGNVTLYAPKTAYEEWRALQASKSQQAKNDEAMAKGETKMYTIKELQLMKKAGLITDKFIEKAIEQGKVIV